MSVFEVVMLLCFGAAWPFSIVKSYKSRKNSGKSLLFLVVILVGYGAGMANKIIYRYDDVLFLYIINAAMVSADILLWFRNRKLEQIQKAV